MHVQNLKFYQPGQSPGARRVARWRLEERGQTVVVLRGLQHVDHVADHGGHDPEWYDVAAAGPVTRHRWWSKLRSFFGGGGGGGIGVL